MRGLEPGDRSNGLARLHALVEAGYPRPQLVRDRWTDLGGRWEFAYDDADAGLRDRWFEPGRGDFDRTITVPYPPESERSGIGDGASHPVVWYRRTLQLPTHGPDERLVLHFGAVDYEARVWLDGRLVGEHQGGSTPFSCELGPTEGDHAVLVVRAEDLLADPSQPRGKQDWRERAHRIWYGRTTGIWQPVWLEVLPPCHLSSVRMAAPAPRSFIGGEVMVSGAIAGHRLRVRIYCEDELLAEQTQSVLSCEVRIAVHLPTLENAWDRERLEWSAESPTLLGAELCLLDRDGVVVDSALSYFGLRSVSAADRHFLINGAPTYLRMVLSQGYWPESHLAAPDRAALRVEAELIKALGFNGVRVHQKIEDPLFLYWADRIGLMVWEEMPSCAGYSGRGIERLVREWMEVVVRDRSHPSIVAWVPFNESWGVQELAGEPAQRHFVAAVAELTRALDPTRPVISNDGWEHVTSDVWGIHDYSDRPDVLRARYGSEESLARVLADRWPAARRVVAEGAIDAGQPIVLSEFGGIAFSREPDPGWHGYSVARDAKELEERLHGLFAAVAACSELAGFCYTQLTDTEQESNGLVWPDRRPKLPIEALRSIIAGDACT